MKKKILTIIYLTTLITCFAFSAKASVIKDFFSQIWDDSKYALNCGNNDLYIPVLTWHNRLFYDDEHIDRYNEEPWGIGYGRSFWDENEWHGVYAMVFEDSNYHPETKSKHRQDAYLLIVHKE